MNKLTVTDLALRGKRVLTRVDFNVPLENRRVTNDNRIRAALPTLRHIVEKGGRLILMSHLGRPKGERIPDMSLEPCAPVLSDLLGREIVFMNDCIGPDVDTAIRRMADGEVLLLENLRFYREETANDPDFAKSLAGHADLYVNDAFGTAHRAHASTEGVTHFIEQCAAGFLMMKELSFLGRVMATPERPFVAILGGAKISGKIEVISNLLPRVDHILIGGGMAYTFFKARGMEIGRSLLEEEKIDTAGEILEKGGDKVILPLDCLVTDKFDFKARRIGELKTVKVDSIPPDWEALDIGGQTIKAFGEILADAKTVVWNGPMGVFEIEETAAGTYAIARMLADRTAKGATTVVGGGDSAAAVNQAGVSDRISHVSTGGGASLEFMEGKVLPGVAALSEKPVG